MNDLRRQLRKQRRQLDRFQQTQAETQIFHRLIRSHQFQSAKHIGLYLHAFGEIQTKKIIKYAFTKNKIIYLPMICEMNQCLVWLPITQKLYNNNRFTHHTLGMKEPKKSRGLHVSQLDLIFMPLLACDSYGTRLGMGGGFYDRTLASAKYKPIRIGLAHNFQLLSQKLLRQKWDQPLDCLITPTHLLNFKR